MFIREGGPPPSPISCSFICKFESNFMKTWFNGCLERLKNGEDSGFEFSKWGKGDSYELYHPFQIHVPKYQIKLVRGLGTEPPKIVALMCAHWRLMRACIEIPCILVVYSSRIIYMLIYNLTHLIKLSIIYLWCIHVFDYHTYWIFSVGDLPFRIISVK